MCQGGGALPLPPPPPRIILAPSTPVAFLEHVLHQRAYPTVVLICTAKHDFLHAAVSELQDAAGAASSPPIQQPDQHAVLRATLARVATARHIQTAFIPSVAHLRAYLSVFPCAAATTSKPVVPAPPTPTPQTPALLVYGFLDVHRDGGEWSAQGIGCSAACLVEAAARAGLAAVLMEPTSWEGGARDEEEGEEARGWAAAYEEQIPLLSTMAAVREDGTWGGPCTSVRTILQRWFTFHDL